MQKKALQAVGEVFLAIALLHASRDGVERGRFASSRKCSLGLPTPLRILWSRSWHRQLHRRKGIVISNTRNQVIRLFHIPPI